MSGDSRTPTPASTEDAALAAPPDELNPALIDARKTFIFTVILAALFIGAVVVLIF